MEYQGVHQFHLLVLYKNLQLNLLLWHILQPNI